MYLSTFSSMSPPTMETNTCRFRTILNSAKSSTSFRRFLGFIFVADNCQPSFPSSRLYCCPLQKLSTITFLWDFVGSFFCTHSWHHRQPKKKTVSRNKIWINFYFWQWTVDNAKTNTMVIPCQNKAQHVFMFSSDQYIKSAPGAVQYCRLRVD